MFLVSCRPSSSSKSIWSVLNLENESFFLSFWDKWNTDGVWTTTGCANSHSLIAHGEHRYRQMMFQYHEPWLHWLEESMELGWGGRKKTRRDSFITYSGFIDIKRNMSIVYFPHTDTFILCYEPSRSWWLKLKPCFILITFLTIKWRHWFFNSQRA